jgi:hypothetical protein
MAPGAAYAWRAWPRICRATLAISVVSMTFPTVTRHLVREGQFLIESQLHSLEEQGLMPTLYTLALGPAGWVVHGILAAAAGWWLVQRYRALPEDGGLPEAPSST